MTALALTKSASTVRLLEVRRHQVYRLERRRPRSLLTRLSRGLHARFR